MKQLTRMVLATLALMCFVGCGDEGDSQCLAAPVCGPDEVQVESCDSATTCQEVSACGQTIYCAEPDPAQCASISEEDACGAAGCDWYEVTVVEPTTCATSAEFRCGTNSNVGNSGVNTLIYRDGDDVVLHNTGTAPDSTWTTCDGSGAPAEPDACSCCTEFGALCTANE